MAEAQQDANEDVAEQQSDAVASTDGSIDDRAEADYDVAIAKADGDRKVAEEACEALSGDAQENCKKQAEEQYDAAKTQAQAQLDAARTGAGATTAPDMTTPSTDSTRCSHRSGDGTAHGQLTYGIKSDALERRRGVTRPAFRFPGPRRGLALRGMRSSMIERSPCADSSHVAPSERSQVRSASGRRCVRRRPPPPSAGSHISSST